MSGAEALELLKRDMVADTVEDYTDLSFFVSDVEKAFGIEDDTELKFMTVAVIHSLLREGLINPGLPLRDGSFEVWSGDPDDVVDRILHEWNNQGRRPNLWEIVWFDATAKGCDLIFRLS